MTTQHPKRRRVRLVAFDMDSTLIQAECIDELAKRAGVGERVAAVTQAAMRGELDFAGSLRERVTLLEGLDESVLAEVYEAIQLTPGAEALCQGLKRRGVVLAICSGGFTYFADRFASRLGVDHVCANRLEIEDGRLTGRVLDPIVDADAKANRLVELCDLYGILLDETAAIGDGANDLKMLKAAGLGIAYHAKPVVAEQADSRIDDGPIDQALALLASRRP